MTGIPKHFMPIEKPPSNTIIVSKPLSMLEPYKAWVDPFQFYPWMGVKIADYRVKMPVS